MTMISYPAMHQYVWRWSSTKHNSGGQQVYAADPCLQLKCPGHPTQENAALHHALWFIDKAVVRYVVKDDEQKRCEGCNAFTLQRVMFEDCPYEDWLVVCQECDARALLKHKHLCRRALDGMGERIRFSHSTHERVYTGKKRGRPPLSDAQKALRLAMRMNSGEVLQEK